MKEEKRKSRKKVVFKHTENKSQSNIYNPNRVKFEKALEKREWEKNPEHKKIDKSSLKLKIRVKIEAK